MPFGFLAREAGRVHVCGHRGYSLHYPENTLPAFAAAKAWGATTIEIDVVLTAEGEPIVLHDRTLDRTTDGHGFAADLGLEQIRSLDVGVGFDARFAGTRVPTVAEVVDWAAREEMGIFLEIKEAERPDLAAIIGITSQIAADGMIAECKDLRHTLRCQIPLGSRAVNRHSRIPARCEARIVPLGVKCAAAATDAVPIDKRSRSLSASASVTAGDARAVGRPLWVGLSRSAEVGEPLQTGGKRSPGQIA
jgi:glycerophosphoryl diester phosphodiesterase